MKNKSLVVGLVSGLAALSPEVIDIDPQIISEHVTTLTQVILGIISLWNLVKSIFKKQ